MKATEILTRCRESTEEIQRLQRRLARLECCAEASASVGEDITRCRQALEARRRALDAEVAAACRIVDMLPDPQCGILYRYFVGGQSQGAIIEALHYTMRYYKRKKKEGLAIAEGMDEAVVDALLPDWYLAAEKQRHEKRPVG